MLTDRIEHAKLPRYSRDRSMNTPTKIAGTRSNRQSTQMVLKHLNNFNAVNSDQLKKILIGPIRINYDYNNFEVYLKGNLVLTVTKNTGVLITNGGYLDKNGNPTASTRELINGIMDALEAKGLAPYTRAYIENKVGKLRVGKIEQQLNANQSYCLVT